ncbi:hypothetical protein [uncultured Erythrobacter sp.]|uniref:hypothetical protein n=1 Tax=uncultured Erythrobacter sp. TaxID=263913 RepID=UPI0026157C5E|nr:hypothetical protein [uncultured Erythrobacter sp.]
MEITLPLFALGCLFGLVNIWMFQGLIDWAITSRFMDDPVKGKILSTLLAYMLGALTYLALSDLWLGFVLYIPGALLIGFLEVRKGARMQQTALDSDETATFE